MTDNQRYCGSCGGIFTQVFPEDDFCSAKCVQSSSECAFFGDAKLSEPDAINPKHYTEHPSGIDCISITEHMNFCLGNAVKYIWRAGLKGETLEDLRKAQWYITREINRLEGK